MTECWGWRTRDGQSHGALQCVPARGCSAGPHRRESELRLGSEPRARAWSDPSHPPFFLRAVGLVERPKADLTLSWLLAGDMTLVFAAGEPPFSRWMMNLCGEQEGGRVWRE